MTVPSCMPLSLSSSTPTQSPLANFTAPTKRTVPALPFQVTFWPTLTPPAEPAAGAGAGGCSGGGGGAGAGVGAGVGAAAGAGAAGGAADAEKGDDQQEKQGSCRACCYAFLDFLATCGRWLVACLKGIGRCCRSTFYPVKELCFDMVGAYDNCMHPYTKKQPVSNVPVFQYHYNSVNSISGPKGSAASLAY
mmetsp:Transcript_29277/g.80338  ORF Transcript_29277/g.80338 Transcript_29277/m.80338 type:complete len:192 (-) Transcript_29277:91-666(-)